MICLSHLLLFITHWVTCYLIPISPCPLSPLPSLRHQQSTRQVSPSPSRAPAAPRLAAEGRASAILVCDNIQVFGSVNPSEAQNSGTSLVLESEDSRGKLGSGLRMADNWKLTRAASGTPSWVLMSKYSEC